ncbi:MAG: protein-L-isoaspartate O-methyltransferase family protein [Brevundimonas sp.]|uniref:protein-L-isoaspartate O-methyltransferase family protein n=1 Tax=Brevundimonas sp. TaxID=1871086 RepID=UPI00391CB6AE
MDFAAARKVMVDSQVRVNDVTDRAIQGAMLAVERERYCAADRQASAYADVTPQIAGGRKLMLPRDLSKLLQALDAREGERALAVAGPYAAAVLSRMGLKATAQDSAEVLAVASAALADDGVATVEGDLSQPAGEGWDVMISEGAVTHRPQTWIDALRVGGRLAVVERTGPVGKAVLYVRGEQGVSRRELFDAAAPVLDVFTPAPAFAL